MNEQTEHHEKNLQTHSMRIYRVELTPKKLTELRIKKYVMMFLYELMEETFILACMKLDSSLRRIKKSRSTSKNMGDLKMTQRSIC